MFNKNYEKNQKISPKFSIITVVKNDYLKFLKQLKVF